jgi:hypothetical protein
MKKLEKSKLQENKTIQISGSKSISNRLLILESLFKNIEIGNLSNSQDTQLLKKALSEDSEIVDIHHGNSDAFSYFLLFYSGRKDNDSYGFQENERKTDQKSGYRFAKSGCRNRISGK